MTDQYTKTALHFEAAELPRLLERHLPHCPLALADLGCGDGPLLFPLSSAAGSSTHSAPLYRRPLWFPLLDPFLFRFGHRYPGHSTRQSLLRALRAPKVPIPGYYSLEAILER